MTRSFSFDGLDIKGAAFVVLPTMLATVAALLSWPQTALSNVLVEKMPVSVEYIPSFCLLWILTIWLVVQFTYMLGVAAVRPGGYANKNPRGMIGDKSLRWLHRLKCSHENTTECLVWFTATLVLIDKFSLDTMLAAKWSILVMLSRTIYPFMYVFDLDMLRTMVFIAGFFSSFFMALAALFQGTALK